jgi:hypothetical protein
MVSTVDMTAKTDVLEEYFTRFNRASIAVRRSNLPRHIKDIAIDVIEMKLAFRYDVQKMFVKRSDVTSRKMLLLAWKKVPRGV